MQAPAAPEKDESFEEPGAVGKVTLHSMDYWVIDSGATYSMTPRADLLTELEPSPVKHVTLAFGQRAEVKGMGKAMFKVADGKIVGLKNVKQCELEESGAAAKEQHKGEENPKAAAEEEYRDSMWGTIASAAFSNSTSAAGECDWLTLHRRMGHVALPILQLLVKNEMVAGIRVKGEPDELLGCPTCIQAKITLHSLDYWVIDSGATYSMTPRADLLTELEPSPVKHATSALGQRAEVKGMGKAMFKGANGKMVGLKNVLWVSNLAANLISVRRLQNAGMDTSSKGAKTYTARLGERILWDLHEDRDVYNEIWQIPVVPMPKERQVAASISNKGEVVRSGVGANGRAKEMKSKKCNLGGTSKLSELEESGAAAQKQHKGEENPKAAAEEEYGENMWGTIASAAFSNPTSATGECDWLTLHRRMGHVALPILQQLVNNKMVAGICVKREPDEVLGCPTCMQAKFTRYPFSSSEATAKAPLDEVVMDVVGPLKLGAAGAEYFLTIVNVYCCMTWVYVLSKKSDVAETVKTDWLPMVERQQDRLVKAIRTDRGGEFLRKEFSLLLKKNGIRHSLNMPYSSAMNGIAERANRTITETARGLLIEAGLPDNFWPNAVRSACVAKNRALNHVGADKWVPYVEWVGKKPKVDMLRVFGCMCMALVPKHFRHNKLGAKAIWAVHLGMAQNSKGWLLWDPFTKKFLVSRDCKFMENLMYKDWKAENEAKIGMRFGEVKSSGLEHVELPLELSSGSTTTRQSSLVNKGEKAKDAEE
ncbi:unnamed protein product [Closterium sp. NIES-53]